MASEALTTSFSFRPRTRTPTVVLTPVANMSSAYGGIRWQSGITRAWQYEKHQSRIGATPWDHPELYLENSALFHLPKVTTPVASSFETPSPSAGLKGTTHVASFFPVGPS